MQELTFESNPLFLFICLILSVGYAFMLYQKGGTWGAINNRVLFLIRTLVVFSIAALLISPMIRQLQNDTEAPVVVFALDNSESLSAVRDSSYLAELTSKIDETAEQLSSKGFDIVFKTLEGKMDGKMSYTAEISNLSGLLKGIENEFDGRNLSHVILVSDGIYNLGISPGFRDYSFQINTLGIGDTIPKSDAAINAVLFNRLSYQGNKFPIVAQVKQQGYDGEGATLTINHEGQTIASREIIMPSRGAVKNFEFLIEADQPGFQRYVVNLSRKEGELTYDNNSKSVFVEIIEGKENIAMIAASPHPDIKAIKSAVESNSNYSFESFVLSNQNDVSKLKSSPKDFDLVIFHQLPNVGNINDQIIQEFQSGYSSFYIWGPQSDLRKLNIQNPILTMQAGRGDYDNITASMNPAFESFDLSDDLKSAFEDFPPLVVPFGNYSLKPNSQVVLYQQVGSIVTSKPLLAVGNNEAHKFAIMTSSGLWKWKLANYANNGNNNQFNELITKLVQYLSSKDDKRKFRVFTLNNEYLTNENITFESEVYNDLYEEVYGVNINLELKDVDNNIFEYSYTTSELNTQFKIAGLEEGIYNYVATAQLNGKTEKASGQLIVKNMQLETLNLTADFELLRDLSQSTNGSFYKEGEFENLADELLKKQPVQIIHSKENVLPIINLVWLLMLVMALLCVEWLVRKYHGSY